jgi:hypothetical protein
MSDLPPIVPEITSGDDTPLPLLVAKRWNFPLAHVETANGTIYAVQDWMRGILGGDVRQVWIHIRNRWFEANNVIKIMPYRSTDNKVYRRPYIDEQGLITVLVHLRRSTGRHRLVEIRNFVASFRPEYEYLKCAQVPEKRVNEYTFQSALVKSLRSILTAYDIHEYYEIPSGHIIDVMLIQRKENSKQEKLSLLFMPLLIEGKVNTREFFKSVGQLICYKAEVSNGIFDTRSTRLALAMPYECIDDYIRQTVQNLSLLLLSVVDGILIDGITGVPIVSEAW